MTPKQHPVIPWLGLGFVALAVCLSAWSGIEAASGLGGAGVYDWMQKDMFDILDEQYSSVNAQNCHSKPATELRMPVDAVAQVPRYNRLLSYIVYPNRTKMLHVHNMALNRAFFYSYIYQKLNTTETFTLQPGLLYYYFSAAADVSANGFNINGSGIFFDNNASYATWYRTLAFNRTLPLFGPRAYRFDDYNEPTNWIREPTNHTINVEDYGAGPQSNYTLKSYKINQWYDIWLPDDWSMKGLDSVRKFSYDIGIKYSNQTGKFIQDTFVGTTIFGPPQPGQKETKYLPVIFTEPYFDCGRSNRWIVSGVSPVVDQIPRYLDWFHLRRETFVAVTVVDMEFLAIDFNPCPLSIGNDPPNILAGTARCKSTTTCEPLYGWGFRRGGYMCMCKPGYRLPPWQNGNFLGIEIDSATQAEYEAGFDCIPIGLRQVIPIIRGNSTYGTPNVPNSFNTMGRKKRGVDGQMEEEYPPGVDPTIWERPAFAKATDRASKKYYNLLQQSTILNRKQRFLRLVNLKEKEASRKKRSIVPRTSYPVRTDAETNRKLPFAPRHKRSTNKNVRNKRDTFDQKQFDRMQQILIHKENINQDNCQTFKPSDLVLPGDVGYAVEIGFSNQARVALRLSHFLSNFLQNVDMYEEYGNLRGDQLLNIEQVFGEVLANTMGDLKVKGSGVFFDIDKFRGPDGNTRQFFGPYAYRYEPSILVTATTDAPVANTHYRAIDHAGLPTTYLDKPWFKNVKERWQSNTYGLTKFREKPMIRADVNGTSLVPFLLFPLYYEAPQEQDGLWSSPYFNCDGYINDWVVTYSIPFFGHNSIHTAIEFKGVVTVDVRLDELDINQCPQDYFIPNAFKDTARCHYDTTMCTFLAGRKFNIGAYKCECKVGFEYPFNDQAWYFDGQTMEEEYRKMLAGNKQNRYENLKCRISGSVRIVFSWTITLILFLVVATASSTMS